MLKTTSFAVEASLALIWAVGQAQAVPIPFEFSGHVTEIIDNGNVLGADIRVGTVFQGSYTFESSVIDSSSGDPHYGRYDSASFVMHVTLPGLDIWSGNENTIQIYDYSTYDAIGFGAFNFDSAGLRVSGMVADLVDTTGSALSSDALPVPVPPISVFTFTGFQIEGFRGDDDQIGFSINGVILPEPGTLYVLLLGTLAVKKRRMVP